jgi:hypothetical protein
MGLSYSSIKTKPMHLRSLTGINHQTFLKLLEVYSQVWNAYNKRYTLEGKERRRASKPKKNNVLPSIEDKLLFVLYNLKNYPLQEALAATFSMNQPQANLWLKLLNKLLYQALDKTLSLPESVGYELKKALDNQPRIIMDVTERPVERSLDQDIQKEHYSGKKKTQHKASADRKSQKKDSFSQ